MSDFKTLKGLYIKHRSSDPSNLIAGEIWYNSTTKTLKVAPKIASWSSGGNLNTGRDTYFGVARNGTQTAFRTTGGYASTANVTNNEAYDGTSWSEDTDHNTARRGGAGAGTQASMAYFGGYDGTAYTGKTEEWDGSSWTESGDMSTGRDSQPS